MGREHSSDRYPSRAASRPTRCCTHPLAGHQCPFPGVHYQPHRAQAANHL